MTRVVMCILQRTLLSLEPGNRRLITIRNAHTNPEPLSNGYYGVLWSSETIYQNLGGACFIQC